MNEAALYGFMSAVFLLSCVNGLFLGAILLFNQRLKTKANRALAFALIGAAIILLYESILYLGLEEQYPFLMLIPFYLISSIPIGVYYFTVYFLRPDRAFGKWDWWILLPLSLEILGEFLFAAWYGDGAETSPYIWGDWVLSILSEGVGLVSCFVLLPRSLQKIMQYRKQLTAHYSTIPKQNIWWLQFFIYALIVISLIWLLSFLEGMLGYDPDFTFAIVALGLSFLLFGLGYTMILGSASFQSIPTDDLSPNPEPKSKQLSKKTDKYHKDLLELMQQEKLFLNSDLQLRDLCQSLDISASYLSQIINEKEGKSFFDFVNYYRVATVKQRLISPEYEHYSIMGIALECGFNTKSTFYSVFKQFVGMTPSAYQKKHKMSPQASE
ncbi:MAG: helix-turn-helix domain-containing protein [Bacteroidota bacterium]